MFQGRILSLSFKHRWLREFKLSLLMQKFGTICRRMHKKEKKAFDWDLKRLKGSRIGHFQMWSFGIRLILS